MSIRILTFAAAMALAASTTVLGQGKMDRSFTASGTSCQQINWAKETLAQYPKIAAACQGVVQRDGKYYVKFEGKVRRVANRGRDVTVDFKNGDSFTLNPAENTSLYVDDVQTPVAALRSGARLTFYVPEDRFAAEFFPAAGAEVAVQEVPISPAPAERVAAAPEKTTPETTEMKPAELPKTASPLPWIGLAGLLFMALGASLTFDRRIRRLRGRA